MQLTKEFYNQYISTELAKALLGKLLVHETPEGRTSGIIVETESYIKDDPAAHSFVGITNRTKTIYEGDPGTSYVYFIYGMYSCFNVVSDLTGNAGAVLIRAVEPVEGIELMYQRRKSFSSRSKRNTNVLSIENLCSGPGKLCVSLGINKMHNGLKLYDPKASLWIEDYKTYAKKDIVTTTRIGITKAKELELRFYVKNSKFISKE